MISKELVEQVVTELIDPNLEFVVELSVSPANQILVLIDSEQGITIDRCVELCKAIEGRLDRDQEDYALEVSSAGLTSPLKDLRQYKKHIGREVEVLLNQGTKVVGILLDANAESFTVENQVKELVEGKKRKQLITRQHTFSYNDVKATKVVVSFR